ncbi:MAG: hypothetical protein ABIF71_09450 [Planctomycetota bacterium]
MPAAKAALDAALKVQDWGAVVKAASTVMENANQSMPEYTAAQEAFTQGSQYAAQEADKLLAAEPTKPQLRAFLVKFGVCPCADKVKAKLNELAEKDLDALLGGKPTPTKVKQFMDEWWDLPVYVKALAAYDAYAQKELDKLLAQYNEVPLAKQLTAFIKEWEAAPEVAKAREALEAEGGRMLTEAKAVTAVTSRKNKLQTIAKYFPGTKAAAEAAGLLGQ